MSGYDTYATNYEPQEEDWDAEISTDFASKATINNSNSYSTSNGHNDAWNDQWGGEPTKPKGRGRGKSNGSHSFGRGKSMNGGFGDSGSSSWDSWDKPSIGRGSSRDNWRSNDDHVDSAPSDDSRIMVPSNMCGKLIGKHSCDDLIWKSFT